MASSTQQQIESAPIRPTTGRGYVQFVALATVTCLLAVMCVAWMSDRFTRDHAIAQQRAVAEATLQQATSTIETLLRDGDLSATRRLLSQLNTTPGVISASLALPDGRIVADTEPSLIVIRDLPQTWRGPADASHLAGGTANDGSFLLQGINVASRGQLFLKLTLSPAPAAAFGVAEYSAFGLVFVAALLAMLIVCRRLRQTLLALTIVGEAIHSFASAKEPPEQLKVDAQLGPTAADWNAVLEQFLVLKRGGQSAAVRATLSGNTSAGPARNGETVRSGNELFAAIDMLPTGVIVLDEKCCVRTANGAGAALLGSDRTAIIGLDVRTLLPGEAFADAVQATQRGGHGGERRTLEIDRSSTHGGILRVNVRPLRREDQGGALVTIEDVTQQRIADASRNQFVAQATHELRAPLTNMRLCLECALEDDANDLEAVTRHLNVLNDETRRLERLVSEMLSVAEIEAGSLTLKSDDVKLDRLFDELKADYAKSCAEKSLTLSFELPPKYPLLRGDRDKLAAALHNLLNNAVKYTPANGKITVAARQDGDRFVIEISDTGFGIPAEDQSRIFERFFRARDPRIAKITGTGLGLALSREVARLHGGSLTFKSELNRGTSFTLQVPVALQPA